MTTVRIVDHAGQHLATGELSRAWRYRGLGPFGPRQVVRVLPDGSYTTTNDGESWGGAVVTLPPGIRLPLWYGGTADIPAEFSLPSGLHNVWGCGNDFDTDAFRIHPDDLPAVIAMAEGT